MIESLVRFAAPAGDRGDGRSASASRMSQKQTGRLGQAGRVKFSTKPRDQGQTCTVRQS
jgi:hypothetical protein